ncbi:unnamed protein product [Hermetia illucens]|uniref:Peptidase S1 domain-containing protein n=2 Tax=Hermetia illucens TaxID=343691 RepID=A0A7R8UW14_HERIL|nr:unnamed protein product [Hermetia illucens]
MRAAIILVLSFILGLGPLEASFIHPRIINGHNATSGQFPWIVTITGKTKSGDQTFCNGVLVSNKAILTAAQCLDGIKRVSVSLGSVKRDVPLVHTTSHHFAIHPKYNATTFANNIGLITLANPLSFTKFIKAIQLPSYIHRSDTFTNSIATLVGFGRLGNTGSPASRLQFAKVKILPEKKCQSYYGSLVSTTNTMCSVGSENDVQGACPNDNGSPLIITEKLTDILIGIASFISTKGCEAGHPTGYVRIGPYVTWIREHIGY